MKSIGKSPIVSPFCKGGLRGIYFSVLCILCSSPLFSEPPKLTLVYPAEGAHIASVKSSFVFGAVSPATSTLWINRSSYPAYRTGSYLAVIPFSPGEFEIRVRAESNGETSEVVRKVFVDPSLVPLPVKGLEIDKDSLEPSKDMTLIAGDALRVSFRGTPLCRAYFRFRNASGVRGKWTEMMESTSPVEGSYYGGALLGPQDKSRDARIEFRLTKPSGASVTAVCKSRIQVKDREFYSVSEVISDEITMRTGPFANGEQMGYDLFLPRGTKLLLNGRIGDEVRAKLSNQVSLWTDSKNLRLLSAGAPVPRVIVNPFKAESKDRSVLTRLDLAEKVPYRVTVSDDLKALTLTLYGAISNIDRIRYDGGPDERMDQVLWFQTSEDTLEIKFRLKEKVWGYDVRYEDGKLLCEILFPPYKKDNILSLNGLTVAVDPGHSLPEKNDGAVSPQGVREPEVNYKIALCLKDKLEAEGAKVFLTREENEKVPLPERGQRAWAARADLYVSVHNNALPDGINPYEKRGYSVFYFQPFSLALARAVHASYGKSVKIPDDGWYYGNLAVCRVTQMPSILTESAYLILPEEEELLLSKDFQCLAASAIASGLKSFLKDYGN